MARIKDVKRLFTGLIKALLILARGKMELRIVDFKSVCEKTGLDPVKISTRLFQLKVPPILFLIGISGSFDLYNYAFMQHQRGLLHKTMDFMGVCCILCNFKKFFKKVVYLFKIKVSIS